MVTLLGQQFLIAKPGRMSLLRFLVRTSPEMRLDLAGPGCNPLNCATASTSCAQCADRQSDGQHLPIVWPRAEDKNEAHEAQKVASILSSSQEERWLARLSEVDERSPEAAHWAP